MRIVSLLPLLLAASLATAASSRPVRRADAGARPERADTARESDTIQAGPPGGDARGELAVNGRVSGLSLSPDGRVWMPTRLGEIFVADSVDGNWKRMAGPKPLPPDSFDGSDIYLPNIDRITWLSARVGVASGYIGRGERSERDAVLRTVDGGARWDTVSTGENGWIYDAFADARGRIWMGGSGEALLVSADSGRTWQKRQGLFDHSRLRSIWIADDGVGVAAALGNALRLTRDGGRTWTAIPTPLDQGRYTPDTRIEHDDHRFLAAAVVRGTLLVAQDHVFASPVGAVAWRELPGEPLTTVTVDRATGTAYALGESRRVYEIGPDLVPRALADRPLYGPAGELAARGGVVYAADEDGGLYRISRGRFVYSRPLTATLARPELALVRGDGERIWAASAHSIFTAGRDGGSWRRMGASPYGIRGLLPLGGGRAMLWDGHGHNLAFDAATGLLTTIAPLNHDDVVDVIARPGLWVAYGGMQYETARRVEVAQTFFPGEFAGSRPNGFVYVSRDAGATWRGVDEWSKGGVSGAFVHPDGAITLISYLGSVRRLTPAGDGYRGEDLLLATAENRGSVPYVQTVGGLTFAGDDGWVDGWIHHVGNRRFVTHDGGRTWAPDSARPDHVERTFAGPGGRFGYNGHRVYAIAADGSERLLWDPGGRGGTEDAEYDRPRILDAGADADGRLLVLLVSGDVYRVDPARAGAVKLPISP
jgi:photosystem II stability/assembly factor-like uncharacterized protein